MMDMIDLTNAVKEIDCVRVRGRSTKTLKEQIAVEKHLKLIANDKMITDFIVSPEFIEHLIRGHLIAEGYISSNTSIKNMNITDETTCEVKYSLNKKIPKPMKQNNEILSHEELLDLKELLMKRQKLHKSTRGFHGALITDLSTKEWFLCEDIGRHNAVDKVIGYAAENDYAFSSCLILISGRLISNMVQKGCKAGIAGMASMTVATDKGIKAAKDANMTLIGSLSEDGFWLYNEGAIMIIKN
jgi:FdhD protein